MCYDLQEAMTAMYRAVNTTPKPALEPVGASLLARRRGKAAPRPSTEV